MDVVGAAALRRAARLATVPVAGAGEIALFVPVGAVSVRIVAPQPLPSQGGDLRLARGEPVARGQQLGGRQVEGLEAQLLLAVPGDLAISGHPAGDEDLAAGLGRAGGLGLLPPFNELHGGLAARLRVIVDLDLAQVAQASFQIQVVYQVGAPLVEIDRARVDHPLCAGQVDLADRGRSLSLGRPEHDPLGRGAAQRDVVGRAAIGHPVGALPRTNDLAALLQDLQVFRHPRRGDAAKGLSLVKGPLKGRAADVAEQDEQVVGVDQGLLGRPPQEVLGMAGQELLQGAGIGDQDGQ